MSYLLDLHVTVEAMRAGQTNALAQMQCSLEIAQSAACASTFRRINPLALAHARASRSDLPLAGLAISVKDLFDVEGEVSASGSKVMAKKPPATQDATAVARLKAAGGVVLGRTHMVEFAFSGIGVNPHFGTPVNPRALQIDPSTPRIPGGSSSGAAVSVASGAAFIGLGSDTGGSIRIPASLCGLVGFKPTASTVSLLGAVPLSHTLDSIGALTRTVRDAILAHELLSGQNVPLQSKPLKQCQFALAQGNMLDDLDADVARNFETSLKAIRDTGAKVTPVAMTEIGELGRIQSLGGFSAPEIQSWLIPAGLWPNRQVEFDPRVAARIAMADTMSAADYVRLHQERQRWMVRVGSALQDFDGVLSPTVPLVAAPIADVAPSEGIDPAQDAARDAAFLRVNTLMLRNTSVVNLANGCAISLPNQPSGCLPTGLMLWHSVGQDHSILRLAEPIEKLLKR